MRNFNNNFLKQLMESKHRIVYCRITSLNLEGIPQETIEGRATQGSVNVDGTSAVRRTCSLSLIANNITATDYMWSLYTRFKLEVGLENNVDNNISDKIIWFNQGIYVITSFSQSVQNNTCTINLQGKDKMCLLNGEVSGILPFEVDFGQYEQIDANGNRAILKYPIADIIKEAVHQYANEPFHNIIVNIGQKGLILQEYRYDKPLYLIRKSDDTEIYINGTFDGNMQIYIDGQSTTLSSIPQYDALVESFTGTAISSTEFTFEPSSAYTYCAAKIDYGETAGYSETELVYTGDLVAKVGETITSILDKIKNMLGNYEYFYNTEGQFIFQEKMTFINNSWTPLASIDGLQYVDAGAEKYSYEFNDATLFTTVSHTPNLTELKNDFSVWGTRKSILGNSVPVHMRYAIDKKPYIYTSINVTDEELKVYNEQYGLSTTGQSSVCYVANGYDIPDITFYAFDTNSFYIATNDGFILDDNTLSLNVANMEYDAMSQSLILPLPSDISAVRVCDWRELIYQMALDYRKYNHLDNFHTKVAAANPDTYNNGLTGYEQYYIDMEGFWRQLYAYEDTATDEFYPQGHEHEFWNKKVYEAPQQLNFWFDFLDSSGELADISVKNIGQRIKASTDQSVRGIYNLSTPLIIFTEQPAETEQDSGYKYFNVGAHNFDKMFSISTQGKTAKTAIDELIYKHAVCAEVLSITSIPIYTLEPNTLISINDSEHNIVGEYTVDKLTVPLGYNGTMSINATKAINRLF